MRYALRRFRKRPGSFRVLRRLPVVSGFDDDDVLLVVNRIVQATPHDRGKGVFWWEPAVAGGLGRRGFFDAEGNALPVVTVFDKFTRR